MLDKIYLTVETIDERLRACEVQLARTDERVEQIHTFALKAWKYGLGLCAVVLGLDIGPILGVL